MLVTLIVFVFFTVAMSNLLAAVLELPVLEPLPEQILLELPMLELPAEQVPAVLELLPELQIRLAVLELLSDRRMQSVQMLQTRHVRFRRSHPEQRHQVL